MSAQRPYVSPEDAQRYHGERVEARQAEKRDPLNDLDRAHRASHSHDAALAAILGHIIGDKPKAPSDTASHIIGNMLASAFLLDALGVPVPASLTRRPKDAFLGMEGIGSALDAAPPFLKFWQKLNADRAAGGLGEAIYKEAKEAFNGGPTPRGALTFIGKEWDGLRAVPAHPYEGKRAYHGEFRQVSDEGTVWRVVANTTGPICYATAEAAIHGARHAKLHSENTKS